MVTTSETQRPPKRADLTIVVPAFNEAKVLPKTLGLVQRSRDKAHARGFSTELIVVDNASTDNTAQVARHGGATVVSEQEPGIGRARNAGAAAASGESFFFLDADTDIGVDAISEICQALEDPTTVGGAPATQYEYKKRALRPYMAMWSVVARIRRMSQGVGQFVRADAFRDVGGYDPTLRMAEDTDFYWRLQSYAKSRGKVVTYLPETVIMPSPRRLDEWPIWKTVLLTNPIVTRLFLRSQWFWRAWREETVR